MRHNINIKIAGISLVLTGLTACSAVSAPPVTPGGSGLASAVLGSPAAATTPTASKSPTTKKKPKSKRRKSSHAKPRVSTAAPAQEPPSTPAALPQPTTPAGCYPLSNEGTCYEPGEFCRKSDHGVTGRAGDGATIVCADNDGWRWEPA
jgi:hypothetical protein